MQTAKGELKFECDWDPMCGEEFVTRDEMHAHELEHWAAVSDED